MKLKRVLLFVLIMSICASVLATPVAAGQSFSDVPADKWYYNDVMAAVELGLVNGKSQELFCPDDYLTYGEAIKLAACMNQLYNEGEITIVQGNPWYQAYVDYCRGKGIIQKDYDYNGYVTRAGYMNIFAKALPDEELQPINNVPDNSIPDVPGSKDYASGVYKLYRAGILQGVDSKHNCNPLSKITRAEVAAILTRMMNKDKRVTFAMEEEKKEEYITMYAPDGRTEAVLKKDVASWKSVGWYTEPVCYVYSLEGSAQLIAKSELSFWQNAGWYTEPVFAVYNSSGNEMIFTLSEIEKGAAISLATATQLAVDYCRKTNTFSYEDISFMAYIYEISESEVMEILYEPFFLDFNNNSYLIGVSLLDVICFYSVNKTTGAVRCCGEGQDYWRGMIKF